MLYLVSEKGQRTMKVGHTDRSAQRQTEYATHSTVAQFIDWVNGSKADEKNWQMTFDFFGFEKVFPEREKSEWYYMPDWINKKKLMSRGFDYLVEVLNEHYVELVENL